MTSEIFKVKKPHWSIFSIKETEKGLYNLYECSNLKHFLQNWLHFEEKYINGLPRYFMEEQAGSITQLRQKK